MHTHAIDPNSAVPFTNRGFAKFSLDECSSAIEDHNEAIRIDPKFSAMSLLLLLLLLLNHSFSLQSLSGLTQDVVLVVHQ